MPKLGYQRLTLFAILIVTLIIYAVSLDAPPLPWDDDSNIFSNPYFQAHFWKIFWTDPYYGLYVPVVSFCWQVLYTLGDAQAWPFRVFNLILHLLNTGLVYLLLKHLAARWRLSAEWPLFAAVMLFAWHPLQVESVAWISGGRDVLSATFALLALLFYFRENSNRSFTLATLFFVASLLSKPSGAVLPVVFWGGDLLLRPAEARRSWLRLLPWLVFSAIAIYLTTSAQSEHLDSVEWWYRPWIMGDTYAFYLRKLVWPLHLSANYARTPEYVVARLYTLLLAGVFALSLMALTIWSWRRERRALVLWLWIFLLLPVSGLVVFGFQKISTTADHYMYLPMVALSAFFMLALDQAKTLRRPIWILSGIFLAAYFVLACMRVQIWRSTDTFFRDMAETSPTDYATAIGMSVVECHEQQNFEQGVHWTDVALAARPNDITALANQAYCLLHAKNHFRVRELDAKLNDLDLKALEAKQPTAYSSFLASLGTSLIELREFEAGYQYLCEAYRIKPAEPTHLRNLEIAAKILRQQSLDSTCPGAKL